MRRVFLSNWSREWVGVVVWIATFTVVIAGVLAMGVRTANNALREAGALTLPTLTRLSDNAIVAFDALEQTATAAPCSSEFHRQVGTVAFLPDGLNEFLYFDGDRVMCSTSVDRFQADLTLGKPDIVADDGRMMWIDRPLGAFGLSGHQGNVYRRRDFGVVVPATLQQALLPDWIRAEALVLAPDGDWWRTGGEEGLYRPALTDGFDWSPAPRDVLLRRFVCQPGGFDCLALAGSLRGLAATRLPAVVLTFPLAALLAGWVRRRTLESLDRSHGFSARFARTLSVDSLVLVYQPLMATGSGAIVGCEVLARWRDVDGTIVTPDRFLPEVERMGATLRFTRMVAEKAHAELVAADIDLRPFRVGLNIFPQDVRAADLLPIVQCFLDDHDRFAVILELVESQQIDVARAAPEIETLRRAGVQVFIDDFGIGYFSVQTLVDLAVDGVKLERAFAMAPSGSVLHRMLPLAIEMVQATGRPVVVEGVETAERLAQLRAIVPPVDLVQGYFISRPIDVVSLKRFCDAHAEGLSSVA